MSIPYNLRIVFLKLSLSLFIIVIIDAGIELVDIAPYPSESKTKILSDFHIGYEKALTMGRVLSDIGIVHWTIPFALF